MKCEVIIIENDFSGQVDKVQLDSFSADIKAVLLREDYDFVGIKELGFFVLFDSNADNKLHIDRQGYKASKEEDVSISLMKSRLNNVINKYIVDSKFLGINARFYLGINCTQTLHDRLNGIDTKSNLATMKQQQGEDKASINLKLESPRYKMGQIELDKKTRKSIEETILLVQKQGLIYDEWGFKEVDGIAKTIINFHGKPGTGKTMSAHIIADALDKKIINSNYADIESKYVGDAPKNLVAAFDLAQKHDAVLFFDEADSFLGKRISNVTQGSEQAMNALRSELLKLLEERPVIVIFATNLLDNYDKAFHSRILQSVEFKLPNKKQRIAIIKKHIPAKLYEKGAKELDEDELKQLSEIADGFSGREIKNSVLNGLIKAAKEDTLPTFLHFKKAFKKYKEEFDKSHESENKTSELGNQVRKNLKKGNYKMVKEKKYGK